MTETVLQLDFLTPQNLRVLEAYVVRSSAVKAATEDFDGWLERIDSLADYSSDLLTQIHGQLIAAGYLKFEIGSSNVGLRYQLSTRGRSALENAHLNRAEAADIDDEFDDQQNDAA